jgi:hypothetical protein
MVKSKRNKFKKRSKTKKRGGVGPDELIKGKRYTTVNQDGHIFKGTFNDSLANEQNQNDSQLIFNDIDYITGHKAQSHVVPKSFIQGIIPEEGNVAYGIGYYQYFRKDYNISPANPGYSINPIQIKKYEPIIVSKNITKTDLDMFIDSYKPYKWDDIVKGGAYINLNEVYNLQNIRNLDPLYWVLIKGCRFLDDNEIILESPLIYKNQTNKFVNSTPSPYTNPNNIIQYYDSIKSGGTNIEQDFINNNLEKLNKINEKYPNLFTIPDIVKIGELKHKYGPSTVSIPIFASKDIDDNYMTRIKLVMSNISQDEFNQNGLFLDLDKILTLPNFKYIDFNQLKLLQLGEGYANGQLKFIKDGKIINLV